MEDSLEKNHLQEQVKRIIWKTIKSQYMIFAKIRTKTREEEMISNYRIEGKVENLNLQIKMFISQFPLLNMELFLCFLVGSWALSSFLAFSGSILEVRLLV